MTGPSRCWFPAPWLFWWQGLLTAGKATWGGSLQYFQVQCFSQHDRFFSGPRCLILWAVLLRILQSQWVRQTGILCRWGFFQQVVAQRLWVTHSTQGSCIRKPALFSQVHQINSLVSHSTQPSSKTQAVQSLWKGGHPHQLAGSPLTLSEIFSWLV
jgi:hypothetical protein